MGQCIEFEPELDLTYILRAALYRQIGEYRMALADLNRAIQISPENARSYVERGEVLYNLKKVQPALNNFNEALRLEPDNSLALGRRATLYRNIRAFSKALRDYNRAILLDPVNAWLYSSRAETYWVVNQKQKAVDDYTFILTLNPELTWVYERRSYGYLWLGNLEAAEADFRHIWQSDKTATLAGWMGEWCAMCQDYFAFVPPVLENLRTLACQEQPDYAVYLSQACLSWSGQAVEKCYQEADKACELKPGLPQAYFWKAIAAAGLNRNEEAYNLIQVTLKLGLPPILLKPLAWLKNLNPLFNYNQYQTLFPTTAPDEGRLSELIEAAENGPAEFNYFKDDDFFEVPRDREAAIAWSNLYLMSYPDLELTELDADDPVAENTDTNPSQNPFDTIYENQAAREIRPAVKLSPPPTPADRESEAEGKLTNYAGEELIEVVPERPSFKTPVNEIALLLSESRGSPTESRGSPNVLSEPEAEPSLSPTLTTFPEKGGPVAHPFIENGSTHTQGLNNKSLEDTSSQGLRSFTGKETFQDLTTFAQNQKKKGDLPFKKEVKSTLPVALENNVKESLVKPVPELANVSQEDFDSNIGVRKNLLLVNDSTPVAPSGSKKIEQGTAESHPHQRLKGIYVTAGIGLGLFVICLVIITVLMTANKPQPPANNNNSVSVITVNATTVNATTTTTAGSTGETTTSVTTSPSSSGANPVVTSTVMPTFTPSTSGPGASVGGGISSPAPSLFPATPAATSGTVSSSPVVPGITSTAVSDQFDKFTNQNLAGNTSQVYSVAFSPNGKYIASGGNDRSIRLWNLDQGGIGLNNSPAILTGHTDAIYSVIFSPDSKLLASSGVDGMIKVWQLNQVNSGAQEIKTLTGHTGSVNLVAFSPDGKMLASASDDKTIKLWDTATGTLIRTLQGHTLLVNSVAFSPDGQILASGSNDKTVKLWNINSGEVLATLTGHDNFVNTVAFSPDGQILASGSSDMTIKLWNVASRKEVTTLTGQSTAISTISFSPDGKTLVSGGADSSIKLWDVSQLGRGKGASQIGTLQSNSVGVFSIAFSPDGKTIASCGRSQLIKLWNYDINLFNQPH